MHDDFMLAHPTVANPGGGGEREGGGLPLFPAYFRGIFFVIGHGFPISLQTTQNDHEHTNHK